MKWRFILPILFMPTVAWAQTYADVPLADIFDGLNLATKGDRAGVGVDKSGKQLHKVHFVAFLRSLPKPCPAGQLQTAYRMIGFPSGLENTAVHDCIEIGDDYGRRVAVFVQNVFVSNLSHEIAIGGVIDIHAEIPGYVVEDDRDAAHPMLMMSAWEKSNATVCGSYHCWCGGTSF